MRLKKIKVYGSLRKFLGKSYFEAAVNSPKDAIKFLVCNFPKVEKHLNEQIYKVKMGGVQVLRDDLALNGEGDIQIIPVALGARNPFEFVLSVVTGGASLAVNLAVTAATAVIKTATAVGSAVAQGAGAVYQASQALAQSGFIGNIANTLLVNTALSGVASLLTPDQSLDISDVSVSGGAGGAGGAGGDPENPNSFPSLGFNQIQNVSVSGGAVPIIYGEVFTGSIVISASTDVQQFISS